MLVALHVSVWKARRYDRVVSNEVNDQKQADRSAGRYNKHLFGTRRGGSAARAPEFFAVLKAAEAMKNVHLTHTLAWGKRDGERLLPTANYFTYTDAMRKAGVAFDSAVSDFVDAYPRLVADARERLGKLYADGDFPQQADVRDRFAYEIAVDPLPTGSGDFRLSLPDDQIAAIEASVTERLERATRDAMADAWGRLHEAVARIRRAAGTQESGKAGIVRENLIDHARDVCDVLKRLNVAGDEHLDELRARVERELTGIAVDDLRTDEKLRADTAKRADDIMAAMGAFYAPSAEDADAA